MRNLQFEFIGGKKKNKLIDKFHFLLKKFHLSLYLCIPFIFHGCFLGIFPFLFPPKISFQDFTALKCTITIILSTLARGKCRKMFCNFLHREREREISTIPPSQRSISTICLIGLYGMMSWTIRTLVLNSWGERTPRYTQHTVSPKSSSKSFGTLARFVKGLKKKSTKHAVYKTRASFSLPYYYLFVRVTRFIFTHDDERTTNAIVP